MEICGVEILDAFSGARRRTTKQDVADVARVADYLDSIAFHWVPISAQDCPPESRSLQSTPWGEDSWGFRGGPDVLVLPIGLVIFLR